MHSKKFSHIIVEVICFYCFSCNGVSKQQRITDVINQWQGKEILFPKEMIFTEYAKDTVDYITDKDFKVLLYVDSLGCTSCKLKLPIWKDFINQIDTIKRIAPSFIFIVHPKNIDDIKQLLKTNGFSTPVFIDLKDETNSLNHFPSQPEYQCFLLDKDNKVLLVGNPVYNEGIKQLYLKIIKEKMQEQKPTTQ